MFSVRYSGRAGLRGPRSWVTLYLISSSLFRFDSFHLLGITMAKRVLILCTGNSCRSQMAEKIWEAEAAKLGLNWEARSAGSNPSGYVHPLAIEAMAELSLPTEGLQSQHVDVFRDETFDLAVTVCDNAKEACPVFPNSSETLHWPFDDPADAQGDDDEKMVVFRRVRDEILEKTSAFLQSERV